MDYAPPAAYGLDVEVVPASELRARVERVPNRGVERVDFYAVLHVTQGRYRHMVDFEVFDARAGSVLVISPGQAHRFGEATRWQGWMLIFRADLFSPSESTRQMALAHHVTALPTHLRLEPAAREAVAETIRRIAADTQLATSPAVVNALLRSQLETVLLRLHVAHEASAPHPQVEPMALHRFRRYREAVEREHASWHQVKRYAQHLGCSEKALSRATMEVAGVGAKALLTARIILEAKRRLAHTVTPVAAVGDELGFEEATNFVKFFRRETGTTPGAFRTQYAASTGPGS